MRKVFKYFWESLKDEKRTSQEKQESEINRNNETIND